MENWENEARTFCVIPQIPKIGVVKFSTQNKSILLYIGSLIVKEFIVRRSDPTKFYTCTRKIRKTFDFSASYHYLNFQEKSYVELNIWLK